MAMGWIFIGNDQRGLSVATADYYREQADTCLHMSRVCPDPILAERLGSLAAEFRRAAAEIDEERAFADPAYRNAYGRERKRA